VTSPTERDMASFIAGTLAADAQDAEFLVEAAMLIRSSDLSLDRLADALDAMACRMTERVRAGERWQKRGMLDETDDQLRLADLAEDHEPGTDHSPTTTPPPTGRRRRT
jgi:hypothetical protein